jgi:hypothetical protein
MEIEASVLPIELRAKKLCHQYALQMLSFSESHPLRKALQLRTLSKLQALAKLSSRCLSYFSRAFYCALGSMALTLRERIIRCKILSVLISDRPKLDVSVAGKRGVMLTEARAVRAIPMLSETRVRVG